jgi:hypothetical protein
VPLEEALTLLDEPHSPFPQRPVQHEERADAAAPKRVADAVAGDRGGGRDRPNQSELEPAGASQNARGQDGGLPGQQQPEGLTPTIRARAR